MKKKKKKKILEKLREFETYDRVYFDGKLSTLLIVILSFLALICLILGCIIF